MSETAEPDMVGMAQDFMNAFTAEPTDGYFAHHGWNQSSAWQLLSQSPMHAFEYRRRQRGAADPDHSRDREIGTVVHKLLLGSHVGFREIDAKDYRTKMAQAQRTQCELDGVTPILAPDMARCVRTANTVREQLQDFGLALDGESELALYWNEIVPVGLGEHNLKCKARLDHVAADGVTILDIKTGEDANPRRLTRRILDAGCHVQAAAYSRALAATHPERAGRIRFIDVFVETTGLVLCTPVEIAGSLLELGERLWLRSCRTWAECVERAMYPGYTTRVLRPEAPVWALNDEATMQEGES